MEFAEHIVKNPIIIRLLKQQESLDNIKQYYVKCKNQDEKYQAIQNIYGVITVGQAIIFCHVSSRFRPLREKDKSFQHFVYLFLCSRRERLPAGWQANCRRTVIPLQFYLAIWW